MRMTLGALAATVLFACSPPEEPAEVTANVPAEQAAIEDGLVPLVSFSGEEDQRLTLTERQADLGVPAIGVAVLKGGELSWAAGYGEGTNADTRFQAASLSKPVAAAGILTLARERGIDFDTDISADLPPSLAAINPGELPITLRGLLSHTAGADVSGFPGYPVGSDIPTTEEVVLGASPANTDEVLIKPNPAGAFSYSGGGYTIAQLWAETVTGEPFDRIMDRLVLEPLGMDHSTFRQEPPERVKDENRARAFFSTGNPVEGGWHLYPEMAAAGLWTTPSDYLRFVSALMAGVNGRDQGLAPDIARAMTTPVASDYGLGIGIREIDSRQRLTHSGSNRGYRSNVLAYPDSGDGVVVMTNAAAGWPMVGDIGRTANVVYGWPMSALIVRERADVAPGELAAYAGDYMVEGDDTVAFTLTASESVLSGRAPSGFRFTLVKIGEDLFIDPNDAEEARFTRDGNTMRVTSGDTTYVRG